MKKIIIAAALAFGPLFAFAQASTSTTDAFSILSIISRIINILIPLAIAAGVLYFIWGVIQYVTAKDEESQTAARTTMISGIIGLFVIVSIWGLVAVVKNTFQISDSNQVDNNDIPCIPGSYVDANGNQLNCPN